MRGLVLSYVILVGCGDSTEVQHDAVAGLDAVIDASALTSDTGVQIDAQSPDGGIDAAISDAAAPDAAACATDCNDGNLCTDDSCGSDGECVHMANSLSCDDGNDCTVGDVCSNRACVGGPPKDCSDGHDCTQDVCTDGVCSNPVETSACLIDDTCYSSGELDPTNDCQMCDGSAPTEWTSRIGSCSDGDACTENDVCDAGSCQPGAQKNCSDGHACTSDLCFAGVCSNPVVVGSCLIDDVCYMNEDPNPASECQECNAGTPTTWSDRTGSCDDGNLCTENDLCGGGSCQSGTPRDCTDGLDCTDDVCALGVCSNPLRSGNCLISDTCYENNDQNPANECLHCSDSSPSIWSNRIGSCDDNDLCTEGDACSDGMCQPGPPKDCSDGHACTSDECNQGLCSNPIAAGSCLIDDACYADAQRNPENDCQECDDTAPTVWTNASGACDDGDGCAGDGCAEGLCVSACDDGDECTLGDMCGGSACLPGTPVQPLDVQADGSPNPVPDLVISEIAPQAFIELFNTTGSDIDLSTAPHWLCSPFLYDSLSTLAPAVTVPSQGFAVIPWPSGFADTAAGGEIILYRDAFFDSGTSILDFTCWGTNPHGSRKGLAETVGKWVQGVSCSPALTNGALHRKVSVAGNQPQSYDTAGAPTPMTCTPPSGS